MGGDFHFMNNIINITTMTFVFVVFISEDCDSTKKNIMQSIHFRCVAILPYPRVLNPVQRGHDFYTLGRGLHEYLNHEFSLSHTCTTLEYLLRFKTFSLYDHIGGALRPESFTMWP